MKKLLALLAMSFALGACGIMTPQARIDKNPEKFSPLTENQKALVKNGQIDRGMSRDAVFLAWGTPASKFEGYEKKRPLERWDYVASRASYSTPMLGGYYNSWGGGYGPYGRGYSPYYGFAVAPEVIYIPYTRASVSFVNGRVDSWERIK